MLRGDHLQTRAMLCNPKMHHKSFFNLVHWPQAKETSIVVGKGKPLMGNYSSFLTPNTEGFKKNGDSHSKSHAKGNRATEVVDLTNEPEKVTVEQAAVLEKAKGASDPTKLPYAEMCEKASLFSRVSIKKPLPGVHTVPTVPGKWVPLFSRMRIKKPISKAPVGTSVSSAQKEGIKKNDDSHSRSLAKGNPVTEVDDVISEPEKVIYEQGDCRSKAPVSCSEPASTECPKACPITSCSSLTSENSQSWPFTKKSGMWKVIESMEVFKKVPQMPHFSPLNELKEKSREILAINMMMKYSYEVEGTL